MAVIKKSFNLCLLLNFYSFFVKADENSWVLISGTESDQNFSLSEGVYGTTQNIGSYGPTLANDRYASGLNTSNFESTSGPRISTVNSYSMLNSGNIGPTKPNIVSLTKTNSINPDTAQKSGYESSLEAVQFGPTTSTSRYGSSLLLGRNEANTRTSHEASSGLSKPNNSQGLNRYEAINILNQHENNPVTNRYGQNLVADRHDINQGASFYGSNLGENPYTNSGANAGIFTSSPCNFPFIYFPERDPVFLNDKGELIEPSGNAIQLQPGDLIYLACTGNGNFLEASAQELTAATCIGDRILKVKGEKRDISGLNCIRAVTGDIKIWQKQCANGKGRIFSIGHKINETHFVSIIEGCYDFHDGIAIYTEHTIYGSALRHAKSYPRKPSQKNTGDIIVFSPDAYNIKKQLQTFENYFGKSQNYITSNSYLKKTQLSPDEDFVYTSSKWSSFFHLNSVPQWYQSLNNRNWRTLEDSIRKLATKAEKELRVITGSHDVLVLGGKLIYLANGKLPIPALTWKVIQDTDSKYAIGFVTLNNAFGPIDISKCCLCPDISAQYGWQNEDYADYKKGLTYACDVNVMKSLFLNIPDLNSKGILMGPNFVGIWNNVGTQEMNLSKTENNTNVGYAPHFNNAQNFSNVSSASIIV